MSMPAEPPPSFDDDYWPEDQAPMVDGPTYPPPAPRVPSSTPPSPAPPAGVPPAPPPAAAPPAPPPPAQWPPADSSIVANNVSKSFGSLVAVSEVTFAVQPGVTALLGPNGAGKSTLIRLLCGLTPPSTGSVWVAGGDPRSDRDARSRIGLVPQQDGVFERERAIDVVTLAAVLSGLDDPEANARWALDTVELDPDLERPLGAYSKGMRQRVKIAQAIVHNPAVLVLDEPLNGLDPRQRRHMIALFHELGDSGCTVLVSSHVLEEVERFGSHVLVVARGRMAAQGDFHAIRALMDNQPLRFRIRCGWARNVGAALLESRAIDGCTATGPNELEVTTSDAPAFRRQVAVICKQIGARLEEVSPLDDDLDSVFRYLVGAAS